MQYWAASQEVQLPCTMNKHKSHQYLVFSCLVTISSPLIFQRVHRQAFFVPDSSTNTPSALLYALKCITTFVASMSLRQSTTTHMSIVITIKTQCNLKVLIEYVIIGFRKIIFRIWTAVSATVDKIGQLVISSYILLYLGPVQVIHELMIFIM